MLVVFCVLLSWTAVCWFAEPFGAVFLGSFLFSVDPLSAIQITAAWGLLGTIFWIMRSGRQYFSGVIGALKRNPWHYACLAVIFLLFFSLQLPGMIACAGTHNSDSAVVGLTSFHIIEGKTRPIYFYSNHYNGSLIAHVTALFHVVFGRSIFHLQLVDVLFYFGFIIVIYMIALRLWNGAAALAAALIAALPPGAVNLLIRNTHVAPLVFFVGALSLYLALRIVEEDKPQWQHYFWLGVVLGIGMWVHLQMAFYGIAVVATLFFKDKLFFARSRFFAMPLGFLLGSVPVLVDIYYFPSAMIWKVASQTDGTADILSRFIAGTKMFLINLPMLFGMRWVGPGSAILPDYVSWLLVVLLSAFLAVFVWRNGGRIIEALRMRSVNIGPAIAILFPFLTWFVMSFTREAQTPSAFRFYYLLWTTVPLILAAALFKSERVGKWLTVGGLSAVALIFASTYPIYYQSWLLPRDKQEREWINYCESHKLSTFYGSFWHTYLTCFLTDERIVGSNLPQWRREYYPPYYLVLYESTDPPVYLVNSENKGFLALLERDLNNLGIGYRKESVALGTVVTGLEASVRPHQLARIHRERYGVSITVSSVRGVRPGNAVDSIRVVDLEVTNSGGAVLLASGMSGYIDLEVRDAAGNVIRRQPLHTDIAPGETVNWRVLLDTDEVEGRPSKCEAAGERSGSKRGEGCTDVRSKAYRPASAR